MMIRLLNPADCRTDRELRAVGRAGPEPRHDGVPACRQKQKPAVGDDTSPTTKPQCSARTSPLGTSAGGSSSYGAQTRAGDDAEAAVAVRVRAQLAWKSCLSGSWWLYRSEFGWAGAVLEC